MLKKLFILSIFFILSSSILGIKSYQNSNVLVITNSSSPGFSNARTYLIPYLEHFGLPYSIVDVAKTNDLKSLNNYALIIIAHKQIKTKLDKSIKQTILNAVSSGVGLVSFDFHFSLQKKYLPAEYNYTKELYFSNFNHYIAERHKEQNKLTLFGKMKLPKLSIKNQNILLSADSLHPLIITTQKEKGRIVTWTTLEWMQSFVVGPLGGLDDCLWRSFVWAARKPFALRGLPPIVTMRVDDVAGQGEVLWNETPLYFVRTANKYGFKPFLSLFIYNLRPSAIKELRNYLLNEQATASPHTFGRPVRTSQPDFKGDYFTNNENKNFYTNYYYNPNAINYRVKEYDEFIYFNWLKQQSWPDSIIDENLRAVDNWYISNAPLPISKYIIPHWYELGVTHLVDKWGIEFIGVIMKPGLNYSGYQLWLQAGPFRNYEEPGASAFVKELRAQQPVYYADFLTVAGRQLFNCVTEIRDNASYEWTPDNDVEATIKRGVIQLKRAINSMALAVLFTHETDFINKIKPKNWDKELKGISKEISDYNPIYITMDDALRYVRATKTSKLENFIKKDANKIKVHFSGYTDIPTHFYLFTKNFNTIHSRLVEIPIFKDKISIEVN